MNQLTCNYHLSFLNNTQKTKLSRKLRSANSKLMPHEIATSIGLTLPQAHAILIVLASVGLCENRLLIYHICAEVPVGSIAFGIGFPALPWICPECGEELNSYDDMTFDLIAIAKEPIEFI
jgi:hypothetical protein